MILDPTSTLDPTFKIHAHWIYPFRLFGKCLIQIDSDDQLLKLDDDNENNPIYYNSEDEVRFDPETTANGEENEDKIGSKSITDPGRSRLTHFGAPYQCHP